MKLMKRSKYRESKLKVTKTCYFCNYQLLLLHNTKINAKHYLSKKFEYVKNELFFCIPAFYPQK
ncbi:hypothetical protein E2C01_011152 [Portunus trituberculatus]|uniref:Uncharacterized protein n=1 Tax=Portunus trituberculatus TaxID=210409 RepID=A0A5B7DAM4_PORTR|nr:hypothetical protein [Portunus trituberculatus]